MIELAKGVELEVVHVAVVVVEVDQQEINVDHQEMTAELGEKSIHAQDRAVVVAVIVEIDAVETVVIDRDRDHA